MIKTYCAAPTVRGHKRPRSACHSTWNSAYQGQRRPLFHRKGRVKRKCAFEHAQNRLSCACARYHPGLCPLYTFYSISWFCKRTVKALTKLRICAGWPGPSQSEHARRHVFAWCCWYNNSLKTQSGEQWRSWLDCSKLSSGWRGPSHFILWYDVWFYQCPGLSTFLNLVNELVH